MFAPLVRALAAAAGELYESTSRYTWTRAGCVAGAESSFPICCALTVARGRRTPNTPARLKGNSNCTYSIIIDWRMIGDAPHSSLQSLVKK